jgi:hypothetical protein
MEWAKVQGRFEDVAFEERTEQIVHLLAQAVGRARTILQSLKSPAMLAPRPLRG